ncbi:MAG: hypothetical protein LBD51_06285 [Bifidobacteriaceae bacterium]|nr:hypothetical protein [Bifidobacteriaceae bacterium]
MADPNSLPGPTAAPGIAVEPALPTAPLAPSDPRFPAPEQALARQIAAQRETEPLVGVQVGAQLFYDKLVQILQTDPHGVRAELLVGVPALLAGFACQAATWQSLVVGLGYPATSVFVLAGTQDGAEYPFSEPMNRLLLEDQYSVWALIAGAARQLTDQPLPDVAATVAHVAESIGSPAFGVPRLPPPHTLGNDNALDVLRAMWPHFLPLLGLTCAIPEEWPVLFGIATQRAIAAVKGVVEPIAAATIALECALPMAHLPMRRLG